MFQRYRAIFDYFDSLLVGLTATPKDEVDRNTYSLFELENGVPTDAFGLEEAVRDGFLVPPKAVSVPLKFQREGINYDQLSDDEKDQWDAFRAKAQAYLRAHQDHVAIQKLRMNRALTGTDLVELERILADSGVGDPADIERAKAESHGLGLFVRSLVGMDREAAKAALGGFLSTKSLGANQIEFVNLVVDHLTEHGAMEAARLYESPFTDLTPRGPEALFTSAQIDELLDAIASVRATAVAA